MSSQETPEIVPPEKRESLAPRVRRTKRVRLPRLDSNWRHQVFEAAATLLGAGILGLLAAYVLLRT